MAGAGAGSAPLPPPYGSPFRLPPATNRVDGLASSVGGTAAAVAAVSNPFLSGSGGAAAGVASAGGTVARGSAGGSTWMGFGVTLQPSTATAGPSAPLSPGLPPAASAAAAVHPPAVVPLSAFINSGQSALESFAEMIPLVQMHSHQQYHQQHQQQLYGTGPTLHLEQQQQRAAWGLGPPSIQHAGLGGGGGSGGTGSGGLEMLPTSSAAVEPRVNGVGGR